MRARVNRNTAARAIRQLESEGLVRTRVGQGTFVERQLPGERRARQQAALDRAIDRLLDEARTLGVEPDELRRRLERRLKATSETAVPMRRLRVRLATWTPIRCTEGHTL